jgi:drug/metabolite transporter (DMT)-like permease
MTLAPIANVVIFWSVAPFFSFLFAWALLGERPRRSYTAIFVLALVGIAMVLRRIRADTYTLVDVIVSPIVAVTFGWLVFGEVPGTGMIVGGLILLASGAWLAREMARRRAEAGAG